MTNPSSDSDHRMRFPIVGRDSRIDLAKYTVQIRGQNIIDYEKLKTDNPRLYKEIVAGEFEADRKQQEELDEILARPAIRSTPELLKSLQSVIAVDKPATGKYFYLPVFCLQSTST